MSEQITRDEWMAEVERVLRETPRHADEGLTAREWGEAWDIGTKAALERLRLLGPRIVSGRRTIIDRAGRANTTFCYRLRAE